MSCVGCGMEIAQGVKFCAACGTAALSQVRVGSPVTPGSATAVRIDAPVWLFCVVGGLVGAIGGYLTRPSAFLVGQLPFETVITGGATLRGFDQLLVPVAQQSLNQMVTWAIVCAVLGGVAGAILRRLNPRTP